MKILLKNATFIDPKSTFHFSSKDILIQEGIISEIDDEIIWNGRRMPVADGQEVDLGTITLESMPASEEDLKTFEPDFDLFRNMKVLKISLL